MRAQLRNLHSPDADLETYLPEDPKDVGLLIQMFVGSQGEPGEDTFDVVVCTPAWLAREVRRIGPIIGRHLLLIDHYDFAQVRSFLINAVESEEAPTWEELGERIGGSASGSSRTNQP